MCILDLCFFDIIMNKNFLAKILLLQAGLLFLGASCVSFNGSSNKQVATTGAGFYLSKDSGETWRQITTMPTAQGVKSLTGVSVYDLVEDKNDNNALYWLTRDRGLFYSYDDGASWSQSVAPLNTGFVYGITINPRDNCTIFATNGRQILRTTDCNRTWKEVYRESVTSRFFKSLAINPLPPYELLALSNSGTMLKSLDNGNSWQIAHDFGAPVERIVFDYNKKGMVFIASQNGGLLRSLDSGKTWENLKPKLKPFAGALSYRRLYIHPLNGGQLYWISKFGILVSKNGGDDWDPINLITPPGGATIYAFGVNPKKDNEIYYTSTVGARSTFYKTVDGGKTWVTRKMPSPQIPTAMRIDPVNNSWIYLGFTIPPAKK